MLSVNEIILLCSLNRNQWSFTDFQCYINDICIVF